MAILTAMEHRSFIKHVSSYSFKKVAMRALGFEPKKEEIRKMIADIDKDGSGMQFYTGVIGNTLRVKFPPLEVAVQGYFLPPEVMPVHASRMGALPLGQTLRACAIVALCLRAKLWASHLAAKWKKSLWHFCYCVCLALPFRFKEKH